MVNDRIALKPIIALCMWPGGELKRPPLITDRASFSDEGSAPEPALRWRGRNTWRSGEMEMTVNYGRFLSKWSGLSTQIDALIGRNWSGKCWLIGLWLYRVTLRVGARLHVIVIFMASSGHLIICVICT